jgi:hypothetical protein
MIAHGSAEAGGMIGFVKVLPSCFGVPRGRGKNIVVLPVERTSGCNFVLRMGVALLLTEAG